MRHILPFFISLFVGIVSFNTMQAQTDSTLVDSTTYKIKFGLRLGTDAGKLIRTFIDDNYSGFELQGDYRLTRNLYLAGEIGTEERILTTDYLDNTSSGSYFKAGVDYNFYINWLDMDNMVYGGLRIGATTFSQELTQFTIYNTDQYYQNPTIITESQEFSGLTALWTELIVGIKAEIFTNLYMGINVQFKGLISEDEPNNYENLFIPGYNRTYDSGRFGFGYGYTIAYRIPIYKKDK